MPSTNRRSCSSLPTGDWSSCSLPILWELLLLDSGDCHFTALLRRLGDLGLVIDLDPDQLLEHLPLSAANQPAPIKKDGRRRVDTERAALGDGAVHVRFSRLALQAAAELHLIEALLLGEILNLAVDIVQPDQRLIVVSPRSEEHTSELQS